jgi:DNA-binding CsgD family transcriptional regulator
MATDDIENLIDLTIKEKKILEYLSTGKTSNEIATLVGLSKKSIDYYRSKIMLKLNIKNLPELISFAIKYSNSNKIFNK